MKEQNDLAAFKQYLFSFMNDATKSTPLTNDEVIAMLQNYGPAGRGLTGGKRTFGDIIERNTCAPYRDCKK